MGTDAEADFAAEASAGKSNNAKREQPARRDDRERARRELWCSCGMTLAAALFAGSGAAAAEAAAKSGEISGRDRRDP